MLRDAPMTSGQEEQEWFLLVTFPDGDIPVQSIPGIAQRYLRQLRAMGPTWQRLNITPGDTTAVFEDGRLSALVDVSDPERNVQVGQLRADLTETSFAAAWVSSSQAMYAPTISEIDPYDEVTAPVTHDNADARVQDAVIWLVGQLNRPVVRYDWVREGEISATTWMLPDTGRRLVGSSGGGMTADVATADAQTQIRP